MLAQVTTISAIVRSQNLSNNPAQLRQKSILIT